MSRRVVVTGMGVFSPLGVDLQTFKSRLFGGECAIKPGTYTYEEDFTITVPVAPIEEGPDIIEGLGRDLLRADPYSQFAVAAADAAIASSGLEFDEALGLRTATIIGTGIGGQQSSDDCHYDMLVRKRKPHPLSILRTIPNAAASHVSIRHGLFGPSFAIASACASAAHSIGVCAELIKSGMCDVGITGASEKCLSFGALTAWKGMHILASETCRPFSKNRNGLVIGEGSGILVLEEESHAKARGAQIYAVLAGYGMNADGKDMINPSTDGAKNAMQMALEKCDVPAAENIYINAHGTGTLLNDPTETKAIRSVFGGDADELIVSSTKSMHGHLLGAAGGVEAVAAILALQNNIVPPTLNLEEPDPACDLNYAGNKAQERKIDLALSNSFAFGGQNAVLAFQSP